ncbi:hypothetical protein F3Y22_tig00110458pilonHSYRG00381 [Hibiscus syriacus]|uniref:Uncharacterized protein n=1 Tax=Hibiscus syriacus TaxID=106335 RepID=A0A6A3AMV2_HIBSY|nr:hypothetical protein F3Y22_tig00110458pilonHSYRG00381 [Hibiscus syriacus]
MSIDNINASYNPISLDHIFEDVDPVSEWIQEKENSLLDGENTDVFPVDTSDDEMNIDDQSQQQNLSHSSSSATPSQSGDGHDGGGLSPIDDDDKHNGDGLNLDLLIGMEKNMFIPVMDIFVIGQNSMEICLLNLVEKEVNQELEQKEKGKTPENILLKVLLPVEDQLLVTLSIMIHLLALMVFIHRDNLHIFNLHMAIIHHFLIMVCHISLKCTIRHQFITHLHFTYHRDQVEITLKVKVKDLIFLVIPVIGETATTQFLRLKERYP